MNVIKHEGFFVNKTRKRILKMIGSYLDMMLWKIQETLNTLKGKAQTIFANISNLDIFDQQKDCT